MGGSKIELRTELDTGKWTTKKIVAYVLLALVVIGLPIYFQSVGNMFMVRIAGVIGIYVLLSLGLNIVVGYAGLLDLGYVAFYGMGAYAGVLFGFVVQDWLRGLSFLGDKADGYTFWLMLPVAALAGAITGLALGTPVLRLRGDYLAIVTLGFGEIVRIFLTNYSVLTGGAAGLPRVGEKIPPAAGQQWAIDTFSMGDFVFTKNLFWYYLIVLLCLFAVFVIRRLDDSRLGRSWVAMREDEVAAASVGISITKTKLWAFSLGAMWGGIAGVTYAYWIGFISPESFNFMESVLICCMIVLGGMGSIRGAVLGAVIIAGLPEIIRWLATLDVFSGFITPEQASLLGDYRFLIFGGLMVVMMALRPQGILPSKRRARELHPVDEIEKEHEDQQLWEAEHKTNSPGHDL